MTLRPALPTLALAAAALLGACAHVDAPPVAIDRGTVIQGVTVVDTRTGKLSPGMTVVVDGARIQRIVSAQAVKVSGSATAVDGRGRFVVPGYLDLHVHAMPAADKQPSYWPLMIASGITGIREMNGSAEVLQRVRQLNADSAAGKVAAPEVLQAAGDILVGLPNAGAAAPFVRKQKDMGAGLVKVVAGSKEVVAAVLASAREQGLPVAGHLPLGMTAVEAAEAGWTAFEHLGAAPGILMDCASEGASVRRALLNGEGAKPVPLGPAAILLPMLGRAADAPFYQRILDSHDPARCAGVARAMTARGTWQVPTLIRLKTMLIAADPAFRDSPDLRYLDRNTQAFWQRLGQSYAEMMPAEAAATFARFYEAQRRLVKVLADSGAGIVTGTDVGGIWVIPGVSLHQEFRELAAAGLTPLQVLQAATLNGARFLGREATMGTVEAGRNADLVLLDADPTRDAAHLGRIAGVMLKGRYFTRAELDAMREDVARRHAQ